MFPRVDEAFATCREHLDQTDARASEIESIFVGYLLAIIHAEFEQHVVRLVAERCRVDGDEHLTSFGAYATGRLVRKIALTELSGYLGSFHSDCKAEFLGQVENTKHHLAYDNIEANRQDVAHRRGSGLTFDELGAFYEDALPVLDAFQKALGVRPSP